MYFWNVDALVQDLKQNRVSGYDKFLYYLVGILFIQVAIFLGRTNLLEFILGLGISIWGIYSCYQVNKAGDNQNFIERMICLSFPIGIRFVVIFTLIGLVTFLPVEILKDTAQRAGDMYAMQMWSIVSYFVSAAFTGLFAIIFYWYLGRKISAVAS